MVREGAMEHTITIDEKFLQLCGSGTLVGAIIKEVGPEKYQFLSKLILIFPQTTPRWKKENGGPKEFIVYEHNIPSLINDILSMQDSGRLDIDIRIPQSGE